MNQIKTCLKMQAKKIGESLKQKAIKSSIQTLEENGSMIDQKTYGLVITLLCPDLLTGLIQKQKAQISHYVLSLLWHYLTVYEQSRIRQFNLNRYSASCDIKKTITPKNFLQLLNFSKNIQDFSIDFSELFKFYNDHRPNSNIIYEALINQYSSLIEDKIDQLAREVSISYRTILLLESKDIDLICKHLNTRNQVIFRGLVASIKDSQSGIYIAPNLNEILSVCKLIRIARNSNPILIYIQQNKASRQETPNLILEKGVRNACLNHLRSIINKVYKGRLLEHVCINFLNKTISEGVKDFCDHVNDYEYKPNRLDYLEADRVRIQTGVYTEPKKTTSTPIRYCYLFKALQKGVSKIYDPNLFKI